MKLGTALSLAVATGVSLALLWGVTFPQVAWGQELTPKQSSAKQEYFAGLETELKSEWPKNRLVRFVFHGHSVPAGYFKTPRVQKFDSYPVLFHQRICELYPTATIDVCTTAIGGENSASGAERFEKDVLALKPDVVFIDYCLNDRRLGVDIAEKHWRKMIQLALVRGVRVVLLTPTPDDNENILDSTSALAAHADSIRKLAEEFKLPIADSYAAFKDIASKGESLSLYLSQSNHPNRKGHEVVTELLIRPFRE